MESNEDLHTAVSNEEPEQPESAQFDDELKDIGEASFGETDAGLEAIIGIDDRKEIGDTTLFPHRAIASLLITARDDSRWVGTAWFISPRTLATAGHCVFIKNSGVPGRDGWVKRITVIPGRKGTQRPFGAKDSTSFRTVTGWANSGNENSDYGAIVLPTPFAGTIGVFDFGVFTDADLLTVDATVSGYPSDKPGTQWFHSRKVTDVGPQKVFYDIDTVGGQSGAPVWRVTNDKPVAIAIHAYGGFTSNSGTRIDNTVNTNLTAWKA